MMISSDVDQETFFHPLDLMEQIASAQEWMFERTSDQNIAMEVRGHWCDYRLFGTWHQEMGALLFACAFDMRLPDAKRQDVAELMLRINEKMVIGHFDVWSDDGLPVFRHAVLLRGTSGASVEQIEDMVDIALAECERYYPAMQFVLWGGKSPSEAIEAAILETVGEA